MARAVKKATFSLHVDVLGDLDAALEGGAAPSKNAFVERALIREIRESRRQRRRLAWEEAMRDPLFVQDVKQVHEDFAAADAETARQIR